jgi:tungstate transport system permease protein
VGFLLEGIAEAFRMVTSGDAEILHAVYVTFHVTLGSTVLAAAVALPYGTWVGVRRPPWAALQVFCLRYAMFVPTVILGLIVYTLLSRRGFLGGLDLLYTKQAVIAGEFLLAFPILGTFAHAAASSDAGRRAYETARTLGASHRRAMWTVMSESRTLLLSAWLVAVARCYAELGIVSTVGGNLRLQTRTLSSTIQLELSRGDFARGVACGVILLLLAMTFAVAGDGLGRERRR